MRFSSISVFACLAAVAIASPTPIDRRDPFTFTLPNRLPITGTFGGITFTTGSNGRTTVTVGRNTTSTTTGSRNRFPFFFKRDDELEMRGLSDVEKRDPFTFTLPNRLPITGTFGGITFATGSNGRTTVTVGRNTTATNTGSRNRFPFFFKRDDELEMRGLDEVEKRDPFTFTLPNRLPVSGNFGGITITNGATGNSVVTTNNSTSSGFNRFPFNFKRDEQIVKREPQFNRFPFTGTFGGITFGPNGISFNSNTTASANTGTTNTGTTTTTNANAGLSTTIQNRINAVLQRLGFNFKRESAMMELAGRAPQPFPVEFLEMQQ